MDMKLLWIGLLLVASCLVVEAAVPQLTDFNTNQFGTAGGIVTIKNGALVTNLVGAGGSSDWTNSAGVVQLIQSTNLLQLPLYLESGGLSNINDGALWDLNLKIPTEDYSRGIRLWVQGTTNSPGGYDYAEEILYNYGFTNNTTQSAGISCINYTRHTNNYTGLFGYLDFQASYGIVGASGGGVEDGLPSPASIITGVGVGVQGYTFGAYGLNVGVDGIVLGFYDNQTNIGVFGAPWRDTSKTNNFSVGVYGGFIDNKQTMPTFISAGGLFDAGTNHEPALIARKYDGSKAIETDYTGDFKTYFGRTINRFATATNYTLTVANHYLVSTATQTNTLPAANAVAAGQIFIIKNKAGTTTVRPAGADTIDGVAADDVLAAKASNSYISDGVSNWEKN